MAGKYDFVVGKKVYFHFDEKTGLYMVSSNKLNFGMAKSLIQGAREELKSIGNEFSGIIIQASPEEMQMTVKVFTSLK